MPADSLTMRRANRHVCCPLIFIELLLEQLFYNRHDVTSRKNRLLLRRAGSRPALLATVGVFRNVRTHRLDLRTTGIYRLRAR